MTRPVIIALPIEDRRRTYGFYQETLKLEPVGQPADDGVPEPLQFSLDERTTLMFVPTGGFGWVIGNRDLAPTSTSEVLLGLTVESAEEVISIVDRMRRHGGQVLAEPEQQEWGFSGVATDPDGHAWQIIADARGAAEEANKYG